VSHAGPHPSGDARIEAGVRAQIALRQALERSGRTVSGWKVGFGSSASRTALGLHAPLIGFLLDDTRLHPGAVVDLNGWATPLAEAEIALQIREDVAADAFPDEAIWSVGAIAPAIELVDLSEPPKDPVVLLSGNVYHRLWLTGEFIDTVDARKSMRSSTAEVTSMGEDLAPVADLEALPGPAGEVLSEVARMAGRHGRGLLAGDVVILGSVVPPQPVHAGGAFRFLLSGHAPIKVSFSD
jgi:2-keto-4-pentenoate hydratase